MKKTILSSLRLASLSLCALALSLSAQNAAQLAPAFQIDGQSVWSPRSVRVGDTNYTWPTPKTLAEAQKEISLETAARTITRNNDMELKGDGKPVLVQFTEPMPGTNYQVRPNLRSLSGDKLSRIIISAQTTNGYTVTPTAPITAALRCTSQWKSQ